MSALVKVRLTPSGGADRIEGVARDSKGDKVLKARVRAAPEKGAANEALEALIAKAFGAPKGQVKVARGTTARLKMVAIAGASAADIEAFLARYPELT